MPSEQKSLIDDLEHLIGDKGIGERAAILRRVTDLFVGTSDKLSDEQVALFDEVMGRLLLEIDISARAAFGHFLATLPNAPPQVVRMLALDDAIDVAGPILSHSGRVDDPTLVECATKNGQAHLHAISLRKRLAECVTDVLVERGNRQVVLSAAANPGSVFSEFGYATLVRRSQADDDLAVCVWLRPEIPRQYLLKLFADASESVKEKMTCEDPSKAGLILEIVARASLRIRACARKRSTSFAAALSHVQSLHAAGKLGERELIEFVRSGQFDETTVALSCISDLPFALIERALVDEQSDQIIVIAKAVGLSWDTVKGILQLQAGAANASMSRLDRSLQSYTRLKVETARKAIRFYRLRELAMASQSEREASREDNLLTSA